MAFRNVKPGLAPFINHIYQYAHLVPICHSAYIFYMLYICNHYSDAIISAMASQTTSISTLCSSLCSGARQRKHQSSAPLSFVWGIHRCPVDSPNKGPVTREIFPFDYVITDNDIGFWWRRTDVHNVWVINYIYVSALHHIQGKAKTVIIHQRNR